MEQESQIPQPQNDEAAAKLLAQLREKLYCGDMSKARRAAHDLSWKQEAGFEILKQALIGRSSIGTKISAAYGLRSVRGRMKKKALEVLLEGLKSPNANTRRVCAKTALMLTKKPQAKQVSQSNDGSKKFGSKTSPTAAGRT
jgi:hypothetical protein